MEQNIQQQASRARRLVAELIPLVRQAESSFKSARNWGIIDIFGGGFFTDLVKHMHLNSASSTMNQINYRLGELRGVLGNIPAAADYTMHVGGFATFADFFFDGAIADLWIESKILSSITQVRELEHKLLLLQRELERM